MNSSPHKSFEYSTSLDSNFLKELFEDDIEYALTVFSDFIVNIDAYWAEVNNAFEAGRVADLKSAIHKCKTLFGYVGHNAFNEVLTQFEIDCSKTNDIRTISNAYAQLANDKIVAVALIRSEHERMERFV